MNIDEQIIELLKDYNGYDFCGAKECSAQAKANELTKYIKQLIAQETTKAINEEQRHRASAVRLAQRLAQIDMYNLYGEPKCENLHHPKKWRHNATQDCPVEQAIRATLQNTLGANQ